MGEAAGVSSKGVEEQVLLTTSKLERLDVGLVSARDGVLVSLCVVAMRLSAGSRVADGFFVKRPALSLKNPWSLLVAIIVKRSGVFLSYLMSVESS